MQPAVGHRAHGSVRALGGSPRSLMKPGFLVHSPCVTHVSHLMSSSAHAPLPALAASATSHQPHARWHVVALPSDQDQTRRQRQGATTAHKRRGAHEAAIAHAMLLFGPSRAFRRGVLARWFRMLALGNRGPPRGRRGRRGKARSAAPTALCAPRARRAQRCSRRLVLSAWFGLWAGPRVTAAAHLLS